MADSMDPALERLVLDDDCRSPRADGQGKFYNPGYDGSTGALVRCAPNNAAFAKLVAQMGSAVAPLAEHPARTTGFGGYRLSLNGSYTTIDSDALYWKEGTQGAVAEDKNQFSTTNINPDGVLQVYAIKLAKGFPFGVELGASFGYMANTTIVAGGGDVRIALFEGFRESVPGFLPDVGVGGGVRTITGTSQLKLTVAAFDTQLSKPIPIAGTVTLHPHVGYQWLRIFGDSGLVDFTPNTSPINLCNYLGDNNPATPEASAPYTGQPVCDGASNTDFNNNVVFDPVRLTRHRINFGTRLRYQMLNFGIHVATDVASPASANPSENLDNLDAPLDDNTTQLADPSDPSGATQLRFNKFGDDPTTPEDDTLGTQWTIAIEIGALF